MPRSILEHPRSCLSADIQVRAWEKELALAESLHLLVELFSTDGGEETEADEPYKTVAKWQKEGWDTSFLDVDEVCTQVNLMTTNQQQKSLKHLPYSRLAAGWYQEEADHKKWTQSTASFKSARCSRS